jgi:ubiquinone/menaquinone biosynthesis C-methylase UbiE
MPGVSFDRAAGYYDATRGLPAEVAGEVAALMAAELAEREVCLELGVGTGRIALPVAARGVQVIGIDLSAAMLERLRLNGGGTLPCPVIQGDVTALPLADASVGAVVACHVLHLIADWRSALDEACRVLRPRGTLLVDFGGPTPAPWSAGCLEILARHGLFRTRPGVTSPEPVAEYLAPRARRRALPEVRFTIESRLADDLYEWENQILAWTWPYTREQLRAACEEIRSSAPALGWALDETAQLEAVIQWWAFDLAE